jgi:hypothetical protein
VGLLVKTVGIGVGFLVIVGFGVGAGRFVFVGLGVGFLVIAGFGVRFRVGGRVFLVGKRRVGLTVFARSR